MLENVSDFKISLLKRNSLNLERNFDFICRCNGKHGMLLLYHWPTKHTFGFKVFIVNT